MKRTVNDVRVIRGTEIGSDYYLVVMKVKLTKRHHKWREVKQGENRRHYLKRWKLKEEGVRWRFSLRLEGNLDRARHWESSNVEEVWGEFKKNIMETAAVCAGCNSTEMLRKELDVGMKMLSRQ